MDNCILFIAYSDDNDIKEVDEKHVCENVRRRGYDIYIKTVEYRDASTKRIAFTSWKKFVPNSLYAKDANEVILLPFNEDFPTQESFNKDGMLSEQIWMDNEGLLHRDGDKPAVIRYINGNVMEEIWYKHGKQHRVGLPAGLTKSNNGDIIIEVWKQNGEYHRDGGPAYVEYDVKKDDISYEQWYQHGKQHRIGGPALTSYWYDRNGNKKIGMQIWFQNNLVHRDGNEPAFSKFENGEEHHWYKNGKHFRENGKPSLLIKKADGSIFREEWYDENDKLIRYTGISLDN